MLSSIKTVSMSVTALALAAMAVPSSQAVTVTITAGTGAGNVVFDSGGFEAPNYVVGVTPTPASPAIGTYTLGTNPTGVTVKTGATASGPTSAFSGSNYLTIDRSVSGGNSNTRIYADLATDISLANSSFAITYAVWSGSGSYTALGVGSDAATSATDYGNLIASYGFDARTASQFIHTYGLTSGDPNIANLDYGTFAVGAWETVTYAWDHLAQSATITAGNNTYTAFEPTNSTATSVGRFILQSNAAVPNFYDAVPEPSSLALAGLGGLLMLRRRK